MNAYDTLPGGVTEIFGAEATAEEAYGLLTVDVPAASWIAALTIARDQLGCTYFDWLSAVDEPAAGFRICAHVVSLEGRRVRRLLLRTTVPHEAPVLASAVDVYAGAAWHERETHEMFGVGFENHPHLVPLLLPENFEGHPLRKDFVLAARVAKAWPGAKEPGESEHGGPKRRQMLPPGVPDPNEWGPQKGQLPPAPARPARTPRAAAGAGAGERPARATGDRPVRRARSVSEGSASQTAAAAPEAAGTSEAAGAARAAEAPAVRPRRTRSASEGSASQAATPTSSEASPTTPEAASTAPAAPATPAAPETGGATEAAGAPEGSEASEGGAVRPRRTRSASEGSASQQADAGEGQPAKPPAPPRTRSTDAPWHNPKPAFAEGEQELAPPPEAAQAPEPAPASAPTAVPEPDPEAEPSDSDPATGTEAPDESDPAEPTDPAGGDPRE
ncbi:NADH-quinone oxidoreductase subunit C [Streptomyces sp. NBC_01431]|uniref:NADH-quinone oxidoreductase subunit C n=1 Tax=Streptomyces sp. NBC_01431 TaxID=2903863 RepID=UPI002E320A77|nr:NADH-quinone oxidoreductase subunit C [Streptomyces sp. NBC_01431]